MDSGNTTAEQHPGILSRRRQTVLQEPPCPAAHGYSLGAAGMAGAQSSKDAVLHTGR